MIDLNLESLLTALRKARAAAFSAESQLRSFFRKHTTSEIVDSVELTSELYELQDRVSESADHFEACASEVIGARDFLGDLLDGLDLAGVPPPKRADTYPDWLGAMNRVMECRARFPALDEQFCERDERDPTLVREDIALSAEYDAACRVEARAFADVTGIDVA